MAKPVKPKFCGPLLARYSGFCPECRNRYWEGTPIQRTPGGRWRHVVCHRLYEDREAQALLARMFPTVLEDPDEGQEEEYEGRCCV